MNYIFVISAGIIGLIVGYFIGQRHITQTIEYRIFIMKALSEEIKERNNTFLSNFSELYHEATDTNGKFTDMDEQIMNMWID